MHFLCQLTLIHSRIS